MKKHYGQKNGDKSCQSNFDKRSSDFGSFLVISLYHLNVYLCTNLMTDGLKRQIHLKFCA